MAWTDSGMKQKAMQRPKMTLVIGTWYRRAVGIVPVIDEIENMVKCWNVAREPVVLWMTVKHQSVTKKTIKLVSVLIETLKKKSQIMQKIINYIEHYNKWSVCHWQKLTPSSNRKF